MSLPKIILSPPMSNLRFFSPARGTVRVLGTYTLNRRRGLWRVLTTLKRAEGGWVNSVGLRNGGIQTAPNKEVILSVSALNQSDWVPLLEALKTKHRLTGVELNVSCPNAVVGMVPVGVVRELREVFDHVIVKVPHALPLNHAGRLIDMGVEYVHVSNTRPSPQGAMSGTSLIEQNIKTIKGIKMIRPEVRVIAGGGIYDLETMLRYEDAGADHLSLGTVLFNPLKSRRLIRSYYERNPL